jgi:two-component system chemotaxis response regulator CheY
MSFTGKVLVADDEAHIRKYTSLLLRSAGVTNIVEATNGREAVALFQSEQPDLVLLDVNMPELDGTEALKQITALDPDAVVVMLTSLATRQVIDETAQHGAAYYLRKDTPRDEILTALKKILAETFEDDDATA